MNRSVVAGVGCAALVVASALAWIEMRGEREFRRLIAAGDAALAGDQTYLAIEAFSGALTLNPRSMLAYLKRGDTYRRRGEYAAALRDLRQAASLDPVAPQPLELLGDVSASTGRHDDAANYYRRCLALDDRAPDVLYKLALAHYRAGRITNAIESVRRALGLNDRLAEAHYLLGMSLRAEKRPTEALRALRRAVEIDVTFAAAREETADLYFGLGRIRDGIEQLEALAAMEPARPERLVSVGLAYARSGRHDAAVLTLGRALDRHPDAAVVYTALGRVWLTIAETNDDGAALRKSMEALRHVVERPDATSEALALYGRALYLSGNLTGAERTLQQAVTRAPLDPLALRYLADTARRLGHSALARDAAIRYAALGEAG